MADQHGGGMAVGAPPAAVVVAIAVAISATFAWLLVYLAGLPFPWLSAGWIAGIVLVAPLLAGALVAAAGRSSSAGAVSGMLVAVALLLTFGAFAAAGDDSGDPAPRGAMLRPALAAVVLAGVVGALAASALRGAGTRLAGGPTLDSPTLESWERRLQAVATLSCAIALVWRGPRLAGGGGAAADGGAAELVERWSAGAFGALGAPGRAGGASLWPAPVLWTLLVASTLLAVRVAASRSRPAGRGVGLPIGAGPAPLLPAGVAVLLALAWLLAEIALARPWSGVLGTLCGGSQIVALAASAPLGARTSRPGFAGLAVAAIVALLVVQLTLGGAQRDQPAWLWVHVLFGVAVVLPVALHFGVRGWLLGAAGGDRRLALLVACGVTLQVMVGVGALLTPPASPWLDWALATLHLWIAVALLAAASGLAPGRAPPRQRPRAAP